MPCPAVLQGIPCDPNPTSPFLVDPHVLLNIKPSVVIWYSIQGMILNIFNHQLIQKFWLISILLQSHTKILLLENLAFINWHQWHHSWRITVFSVAWKPANKREVLGTSLEVRWLRLPTSTAGGASSIPDQGTNQGSGCCVAWPKKREREREREREKGVLSSPTIGRNSHPSPRMPHLLGVRQD